MKLHPWAITTSAAVLTAALFAVPLAASAATPTPTPTATSSASARDCTFGEHLVHVWLHLPADLRADLKDLKSLDQGARGAAARTIRDGALAGDYGPGVQSRAERVRDHRIHALADLPDNLKADLKKLRDAAPGDRADLAQQIGQTALDGGYGTKAQATAKRVQGSDAWKNCVAS